MIGFDHIVLVFTPEPVLRTEKGLQLTRQEAGNDFFGGNTQTQEPLFGAQLHATYIFTPVFWLALSLGEVIGGRIAVNGIEKEILNNSRYGITAAYKLNKSHSLKAAFSNRLFTSTGNDFNTFLIAYQFMWFNKN